MPYVDMAAGAAASFEGYAKTTFTVGMAGLAAAQFQGWLNQPAMDHAFAGLGPVAFAGWASSADLPKMTSVDVVSSIRIRLNFSQPMKKDTKLLNTSNYQVNPDEAGAIGVTIQSVSPEPISLPTYVELNISEMTDGKAYIAAIAPHGVPNCPTNAAGLGIDPGHDEKPFTAVGDAPTILRVEPISANRVNVVFSENMKDNADIRDISKYSFDKGLSVLSVLNMEGDTVELVTSDQIPGEVYTLTMNP